MTTSIGMKTEIGEEAIILASDTQLSSLDATEKSSFLKIVYGDFWAITQVGVYDNNMKSFYNKLRNPSDKRYKDFSKEKLIRMVNKAIERKRFFEIDQLNAESIKDGIKVDDLAQFIMAINNPKIDLFHIDIFGNLKSLSSDENYFVLGGGKEKVERYLEENIEGGSIDSSNIDLDKATRLCWNSLKYALKKPNSDIFSGWPIDIAVIKKDKIKSYGEMIKEAHEETDKNLLDKIIKDQMIIKDQIT